VAGLSLDRLQRHPGLPQSGQAGVSQLVARAVREAGPVAGRQHQLIQPVRGQRVAAARTLQHDEHRCRVCESGPFEFEVTGQAAEESGRDRDQPLMTALALVDEQSGLTQSEVLHPQPEDLATAQTTEQHRLDHRPVPPAPQRLEQGVDLLGFQDLRERAGSTDQGDAVTSADLPAGRKSPRDGVLTDLLQQQQPREQPGDRREPALDRPGRQAGLPVGQPDDGAVTTSSALLVDKREHVTHDDFVGFLGDHREEGTQVRRGRQDCVRAAPSRDETQVPIKDWMPHLRHLVNTETSRQNTRI
jgi:hypothetical protein